MRIPVPNNRLVAFTLVGALLTTVVAVGLAAPGLGFGLGTDSPGEAVGTESGASEQIAADAPEPNQDFTPAVQTQSSYEEHEEYEEGYEDDDHDEYEDEEHEEGYEDDEHDEYEDEYEE
ncbi:MAG: hypothetical protein V5A36_00680 [Natronomonas sp.]